MTLPWTEPQQPAAPDEPVLQLTGQARRFGPGLALDGVDLTVGPGEVLGYVGPNGAGKTTTFRVLMGLARADSGRATVLDLDCWTRARDVHRVVGHVSGEPRFAPRLTGWQHVQRISRLRGRRDGDGAGPSVGPGSGDADRAGLAGQSAEARRHPRAGPSAPAAAARQPGPCWPTCVPSCPATGCAIWIAAGTTSRRACCPGIGRRGRDRPR